LWERSKNCGQDQRTVGKIKEWLLKYYFILSCDSMIFSARTRKKESDKKTSRYRQFARQWSSPWSPLIPAVWFTIFEHFQMVC
jgi:hypothetical protein